MPAVAVLGPCPGRRSAWAAAFARAVGGVLVPAAAWRDDETALPRTARLVATARPAPLLVLEADETQSAHGVIGECADPGVGVVLLATVVVADAAAAVEALGGGDESARLLLEAFECATHHALAGDDPAPRAVLQALQPDAVPVEPLPDRLVVPEGHTDPHSVPDGATSPSLAAAESLLGRLRPLGAERDEAGWLRLLNGEWDGTVPEHGAPVIAFRHEGGRPLHARRWERLTRRWASACRPDAGLRVAGLCRLSSEPGWTHRWDQLGRDVGLHPLVADDEACVHDDPEDALLCPGHELAVLAWGSGWDAEELRRELASATLTEEEFLAGPAAW